MKTIELFYLISTIISLMACAPQIKQLIKTRRSDEFNMATWTTWFLTQFVSLSYALSVGEMILVIANFFWVSFYMTMVGLIVYYRRRPALETVVVSDERR